MTLYASLTTWSLYSGVTTDHTLRQLNHTGQRNCISMATDAPPRTAANRTAFFLKHRPPSYQRITHYEQIVPLDLFVTENEMEQLS